MELSITEPQSNLGLNQRVKVEEVFRTGGTNGSTGRGSDAAQPRQTDRDTGGGGGVTLDTVRSVISCSKARVSSACFWLCSAIFSLNFLGLEPPLLGELDMLRGRASTMSAERV